MRILVRLGVALLLLFPLLALAPQPARAHDTLRQTTPRAGAVTAPIASVSMVFNAAVLSTGAAVQVRGPNGESAKGAPAINAATVTQPLRQPLAGGRYKVTWRVLSSDGHPISGTFDFVVTGAAAPTQTATRAPSLTAAGASPATSSVPTPPVQQVPTTSTDNNAPLIIAATALALLLLAGGAFLAKSRLKDDDADLDQTSEQSFHHVDGDPED